MNHTTCNMRTRFRYLLAFLLTVLILFVFYLKDTTNKPDENTIQGEEGNVPPRPFVFDGGGRKAIPAPVILKSHVRNSDNNRVQEVEFGVQSLTKVIQEKNKNVCQPKVNITLLKVHKTGSSTLQNIFLRYGDQKNLNFAIPPIGHHLGYPSFFEKKHMIPVKGVCNIFCHHARFSTEVLEVMPPSSVYISILRDPVTVFESAFTYFKLDSRAGMPGDPDAMSKFLERPKYFYNTMRSKVHARNVMLYDFGFPEEDFDDEVLIKKAIKMIEKQFDLIVVSEYFDESLILLKELLCFSLEDIAFFKMNSRKEGSVQKLSDIVRKNIISWNRGDILLYEHFNRTIRNKIQAYGVQRMAVEVQKLQDMNQKLFDRCIATDHGGQGDGKYRIFQPPGVKINTFVLKESAKNDPLCERMVRPEIAYTQQLRRKQFPNFKVPNGQQQRKRRLPVPVNKIPKKY